VPRTLIIGVMGPGEGAGRQDLVWAAALGRAIATQGWVTLSGGREAGVMAAVTQAAAAAGGLTVGILPGRDGSACASGLHLPIATGMGNGRNNINVLASDLIVAFISRPGPGTVSEIALALKAGKPLILLGGTPHDDAFYQRLAAGKYRRASDVNHVMALLDEERQRLPATFTPLWVTGSRKVDQE